MAQYVNPCWNNADDEKLVRYKTVKKCINGNCQLKAEGAILRCKARWYEGEKRTKYFGKLEKRNYDSKHISEIETENG